MDQRDAVIFGEGEIGDQRRRHRQRPAGRRDRGDTVPDIGQRDAVQLAVKQPARKYRRRDPDDGPEEMADFLKHA